MAAKEKKPAWDGVPMRTFICVGRRPTKGGKLSSFFFEEGHPEEDVIGLGFKGTFPGQRFKIAMREDGTYWPGSIEYLDPLDKEDPRVREWVLEDRAWYGADQVRLRNEKAKRENTELGDFTLDELRAMVARLPYNQGTALVAQALRYLYR
jgi:hypothetical protein